MLQLFDARLEELWFLECGADYLDEFVCGLLVLVDGLLFGVVGVVESFHKCVGSLKLVVVGCTGTGLWLVWATGGVPMALVVVGLAHGRGVAIDPRRRESW